MLLSSILASATSHSLAPAPDQYLASLFAALGDHTRLRLVARLSVEGPLSITRLTAGGGITRQAVTKHLQVLSETGLASSSRLGRESLWSLDPTPLSAASDCIEGISEQWNQALRRLKDFVEC
ncbi:MAG: ArsR/SmtB family transcription factor [Chloroflexota bacterium]